MTEKRDIRITFRLSPSEMERVKTKMAEMGTTNAAAYSRKMALDGYCVNLDLSDVKELVSLLRRCSNNLNQYAKKAHQTGSIYVWKMQPEYCIFSCFVRYKSCANAGSADAG